MNNDAMRAARPFLAVVLVAIALFRHPSTVSAADKRPVPSAIVTDSAGAPLALSLVATEGQWLFLYVSADSTASKRLLDAMAKWELTSLDHLLVIVGGDAAQAGPLVAADHGLRGAQFASDARREAWTALQLSGVPTLVGVRNNLLEWRLAGVLNDPEAFKSVVVSWLAGPAQ